MSKQATRYLVRHRSRGHQVFDTRSGEVVARFWLPGGAIRRARVLNARERLNERLIENGEGLVIIRNDGSCWRIGAGGIFERCH
jgi:hypothetical protein